MNEFFRVKRFHDKYTIMARYKSDAKNKYQHFLTKQDLEFIIDGNNMKSYIRNKIFSQNTFIDPDFGKYSSEYKNKKDLLTPIFNTKKQAQDFLDNIIVPHMMEGKLSGFPDYAGFFSSF